MNILGFVWSDLGSLIDLDLVILVSFCNMTMREVPRVVWTKFCYCLLLLVLFRSLFKSETFKVRLVGINPLVPGDFFSRISLLKLVERCIA